MGKERASKTYVPLISVIIPVYNTEESYLRDCFYPFIHYFDPRIEVIVVDDGSQRSTVDFLRYLVKNSPNSIRLLQRNNGGQNAARNTGIAASTGEYIEFIDSDDFVDWQAQLRVLNALEAHNPDILGVNVIRCTPTRVSIGTLQYAEPNSSYDEVPAECVFRKCGALWSLIIRRDLFERANIQLVEGIYIGEDLASVVPLIMSAKRVGIIGADLYHFVDRPTSITHIVHSERLLDITKAFDFIQNWMRSKIMDGTLDEEHWMPEVERLAIMHISFGGVGRAVDWEGVHSPAVPTLKDYMNQHFPHWRNNKIYKSDGSMHTLNAKLVLGGHYRAYLLCLHVRRMLIRFASVRKRVAKN